MIFRSEMRRMEVEGRHYAFLVPSSVFIELDFDARFILDALEEGPKPLAELSVDEPKREVLRELAHIGAIHREGPTLVPIPVPMSAPPEPPPLSSLVLNVTNSCNLSCRYCYEYGDDRLAKPETANVMNEEVARQSVDLLLAQSKKNQRLQLTFFGGETLMNFKVIQPTVAYARKRAKDEGQFIDFSLTTNATLLTPAMVQWLAENNIGVTVSIDGPRDFQDGMRVYKNGMGSYDVVAPRIAELLRVHRGRPIGARVTVTAKTLDLPRIRRHLVDEMGF
ncbi:MAG: radical SAM protein [Vicinamibacteria bacterium]